MSGSPDLVVNATSMTLVCSDSFTVSTIAARSAAEMMPSSATLRPIASSRSNPMACSQAELASTSFPVSRSVIVDMAGFA